ncbi:hypothetical protein LJC59_07155 [Desulfovibrio sp. OttesenSCG-928-A18]|nr:hypothetical protein [Desulfovibrio sp. OttesenSCG-928-A18]
MSMKKIVGIVVVLLVIAGAVGYFAFVPNLEKKQEEQVKAFIENVLPGNFTAGSVKVTFIGKKAEIKDFSGTLKDSMGRDVAMKIDRVTATGLNFDVEKSTGPVHLADSLQCDGLTLTSSGMVDFMGQPVNDKFTVKEMRFDNIRGDLMKAIALFKAEAPLSKKVEVLSTFLLGSISVKGYALESQSIVGPIGFYIDSVDAKDMSMLTVRDLHWNKLRVSFGGSEVLTLGALRMGRVDMPDLNTPLLTAMENNVYDPLRPLLGAMAKKPVIIEGMAMENLLVNVPEADVRMSMDKAVVNLTIDPSKVVFKGTMSKLVLPPVLYSEFSYDCKKFARAYGENLELSGSMDVAVNQKDGKGDIIIRDVTLSDSKLGSFKGEGELLFEGEGGSLEALMKRGGETFLKKCTLVLEDKAFANVIFGAILKEEQEYNGDKAGMTVQELRRQTAGELLEELAERSERRRVSTDMRLNVEAFAKLIAEPGTLKLEYSPTRPINMDDLEDAGEDGQPALNTKATFTPAR